MTPRLWESKTSEASIRGLLRGYQWLLSVDLKLNQLLHPACLFLLLYQFKKRYVYWWLFLQWQMIAFCIQTNWIKTIACSNVAQIGIFSPDQTRRWKEDRMSQCRPIIFRPDHKHRSRDGFQLEQQRDFHSHQLQVHPDRPPAHNQQASYGIWLTPSFFRS